MGKSRTVSRSIERAAKVRLAGKAIYNLNDALNALRNGAQLGPQALNDINAAYGNSSAIVCARLQMSRSSTRGVESRP